MSHTQPSIHATHPPRRRTSPVVTVARGAARLARLATRPAIRPAAGRALATATCALLLGAATPVVAGEPEFALSIFQLLQEVAPGEFEARSINLSTAVGPSAAAAVSTISDQEGQVRVGVTAAVAGPQVDEDDLPQVRVPPGWTVETKVGQQVSMPADDPDDP